MSSVLGDVLVDGVAHDPGAALVSVLDIAVQRGYGCFEALRSYGGRPFRLGGHLDRLTAGAGALRIPLPPRADLEQWVGRVAAGAGDAVVRLIVTGGIDLHRPGVESRVVVFAEDPGPVPDAYRVLPVAAPWHSTRERYRLTGVKALSYAPNLAATLEARERGYDDALLIGRSGEVLEGPTFSIGWVAAGTIETPSLDLGILASITRSAVIEVAASQGRVVAEVAADLDRVAAADEVFVMSTVREVAPVVAVGEHTLGPGPVTAALAAAFRALVDAETAR